MEKMNSAIYSAAKNILVYTLLLVVAISFYRLITVHVLARFLWWAFFIILLFLPIFSYLLQIKFLQLNPKIKGWKLFLFPMLMIWIAALGVSLTLFVAFKMDWDWFYSAVPVETDNVSFYKLLRGHLRWYTIYGIPSVLLSRVIVWLQHKFRK